VFRVDGRVAVDPGALQQQCRRICLAGAASTRKGRLRRRAQVLLSRHWQHGRRRDKDKAPA